MRSRRVAIVGVGNSTIGRSTGLSLEQLSAQACLAAIEDAGIGLLEIDGVAVHVTPWEPLAATQIADLLGLDELAFFSGSFDGPTYATAAINAITAVASGTCDVCLTLRSIKRTGSAPQSRLTDMASAKGNNQFLSPYGALGAIHWAGMMKQRHMEIFGTTDEQFGAYLIAQREFAIRNDEAVFRLPLEMGDYLDSRYVSEPLRLLDCDYPIDSSGAVIFTTEERAKDLRQPAVMVDAWALGTANVGDFYILDELTVGAPFAAARRMWSRTGLTAGDVDVAGVYDGFSIIALQWLEAFGFCGVGESGPFVESGATRAGGSIPVNTDGGACNVGRRHGTNFFIEMTRQLRGQCGDRQIDGAEVAVVSNGAGRLAGCVVLTR